jgi:hypothetical protein
MAGMAAVAALALAPGAAADVTVRSLKGAEVRAKHLDPEGENNVAGRVRCPGSMRAVTGGAFWHAPGAPPRVGYDSPFPRQPQVSGSVPTPDGEGWFAQGRGISGPGVPSLRLTVRVVCLPPGRLAGWAMRTREITPPNTEAGGGRAECPAGKRAIGGGASWHPAGAAPGADTADRGLLASSTITGDRRAWYADGTDNWVPAPDSVLRVAVICLPPRSIGPVTLKERTIRNVPDDELAGCGVRCRRGQRVLGGGIVWHPPSGSDPPAGNEGIFGSSNAPVGPRRWFAAGHNFNSGGTGGPRSLTVAALCLRGG